MSEIGIGIITSVASVVSGCTEAVISVGRYLAAGHEQINELRRQSAGTTAPLQARQRAVCQQLSSCVIRPQAAPEVQQHVHAVLTATTLHELESAHEQLAAVVHHEQHAIIHELVAPRIANATVTTGFQHVQQLPSPNSILVIGENEQGQALQHELTVVPGEPISLRTETLGFTDGSCSAVHERYLEALRQQGITLASMSRTRTRRHALQARRQVVGRQR